jgi:hypothetical protein
MTQQNATSKDTIVTLASLWPWLLLSTVAQKHSSCEQGAFTSKMCLLSSTTSHFAPATRVRARVWSCVICGGQSGAGAGFLRVLRFPLPIYIPSIAPQSPSFIIWGWYNSLVAAAVPSGLSLTPLRIITKIIIITSHQNYEYLLLFAKLLAMCTPTCTHRYHQLSLHVAFEMAQSV